MDENGTVVAMISKSYEPQKQKSNFGLQLVIKVLSIWVLSTHKVWQNFNFYDLFHLF